MRCVARWVIQKNSRDSKACAGESCLNLRPFASLTSRSWSLQWDLVAGDFSARFRPDN